MESPPFQLKPSFCAVTWEGESVDQPLRLALVACARGEPAAVELIILRRFATGRVYLAAMVDCTDRVIEWIEFWVQSAESILESPAARCGLVTNALLDLAWDKEVEALRKLSPADFIAVLGDRQQDRRALVVDAGKHTIVALREASSGEPLLLCRDDTALKAAGFESYGATLQRRFETRATGGELKWHSPAGLDLPSLAAAGISSASSGNGPWLDFNVGAGRMMIRRHRPISLTGFVDQLSSMTDQTRGETVGTPPLELPRLIESDLIEHRRSISSESNELFGEGNELEPFYLRLALWFAAVKETYFASAQQERPFFNLTHESFRISLDGVSTLVPPNWLFQVKLVVPGSAVALDYPGMDQRFFPTANGLESSLTDRFGGWNVGSGTVRLTQVANDSDHVRLEGILDGPGLRETTPDTRVWVRIPLEERAISFIAMLEAEPTGLRGGTRFKATVDDLPEALQGRLISSSLPRRPCEITLLNPVSPALDIHSLGLIGLRLLLSNDPETLRNLEDDLFDLAAMLPRDSSSSHLQSLASSNDVTARLKRLLSPAGWLTTTAAAAIPADLWLGLVHEMMEFVATEDGFDGANEGSENPEPWLVPLRRRVHSLEQLTLHTRDLLVAPRTSYDDIAGVVQQFISGDADVT